MAEREFLVDLNLGKNQLLNAVIHKSATAPADPVEGQIYQNTTDGHLYHYTGSAWVSLSEGTLTVAAGSQDLLEIVGSEISVKSLLISDVFVDDTNATLAAFVAAHYTAGTEYQKGDLVVLATAASDAERTWIHNGGTAHTAADFTALSVNVTTATIRAAVSGGDGIAYDSGSGVIAADVDDATIGIDGNSKLQVKSGSIGTSHIADDAVTKAKLGSDIAGSGLSQNADGSIKLADGYAVTVGDGVNESYTATHNLGTKDLEVNVYRISTGITVETEVVRTTDNAITIGFAGIIGVNSYRVLVKAVF